MAQDFERLFARNVGTSAVTLMTSNSDDALIGIRITNVLTATIQVDVYISSGGNDYHIAKNLSIPQGSGYELIQDGSKVNLLTGDVLKIKSDTASSADVWVSFIDSIST
jgi:hypothetical protein|tara:strand:+ start:24 stop:350 length:327 start_codon:yes stop_codon:yes gene_type:complete